MTFTRITVVGMVADGMTTDEILADYPGPRRRRRRRSTSLRGRGGPGARASARRRLKFLVDSALSPRLAEQLAAGAF
jgi:hypothetical protein